MIKFENVSKHYGKNVVLENLSFEIKDGERVFISGKSGVGKTTLIRIIAGLEHCTGNVLVDKKVALMFQESRLFEHLSAIENVICVCEKIDDDKRKIAENLLFELGLGNDINTLAKELSGGMAQRVALARTLMADRDILILDEPFSALDPSTKKLAVDLVDAYCKNGRTLILISHIEGDKLLLCNKEIAL